MDEPMVNDLTTVHPPTALPRRVASRRVVAPMGGSTNVKKEKPGVRHGSDRAIPVKSSGREAHFGRLSQPSATADETLGGEQ